MPEEHFIIRYSKALAIIGAVLNVLLFIIIVGVTLSHPAPNTVSALFFYVSYGLLFCLGFYLILIAVKYKIIVKDKEITVLPIFAKPYTILVDDIVLVVRKEHYSHNVMLEEILIKTIEGKRINAVSIQISYERLLRKIESNINKECLVGFENRREKDRSLINFHIIESIKVLASTPELQLSLFSGKTDEIASSLDGSLLIYENDTASRYRCFSKKEYKLISDLNKLLNSFDHEKWTEYAIKTSKEWEEIRIQARDILNTLGVERLMEDNEKK